MTAAPDDARDRASERLGRHAGTNPFSTRYVRPGALRFVFPAGESAEKLIARLSANGWWGQIIGPHGSGKSTLLATLLPALRSAGRQPVDISLHDGERSLAAHRQRLATAGPRSLVIVDGYEQLSAWNKWRLRRACRRRRLGLLVTAHRDVGLPTLWSTVVDTPTAEAVFRQLIPAPATVSAADLRAALAEHQGDLREAFFTLYDLYELRRP